MGRPLAVVTGASSGIGAASARALAGDGYEVICTARRTDRIEKLAQEIDGRAVTCDVTDKQAVAALAAEVGDRLALLVNNAGGALGKEPFADTDLELWQQMYDMNVMGTARVTQALLPALLAHGQGQVQFITSVAADAPYEAGGGYCGVKSAERSMVGSLRLELVDKPIRVCEVAPGMVRTEEFSLVRFGGDQARADAEYTGVQDPLSAEDIAECVRWVAAQPEHVNIDRLVVRPRIQAANHKVHKVAAQS